MTFAIHLRLIGLFTLYIILANMTINKLKWENPAMNIKSIIPIITVITLVAVAIIGAITLINTRPAPVEIVINPPPPTATALPTNTPAPLVVYVTGAVMNPEITVSLPVGSRVADAIEQAGGFSNTANQTAVNLVDIVRDGMQIHVPSHDSTSADNFMTATPAASGAGIVYINRATIDDLMTLPNVGQVTAERIIAYREANGNFTSLEDLDNVDGIGPSTLERLAPFISFEP
jgi:competence protein ComEA